MTIISPWAKQSLARMSPELRLDSNQSAFVAQELTQVETRIYTELYPALKARELLPIDSAWRNPGAATFIWGRYKGMGKVEAINNQGNLIPRVDAQYDTQTYTLKEYTAQFGYSLSEVEQSAYAGKPIDVVKAKLAAQYVQQKLEDIAAFGDATAGVATGLVNDADCVSTKLTATADWTLAGTTIATILEDAAKLIGEVRRKSGENYQTTHLALGSNVYRALTQKFNGLSTLNAIQVLAQAFPGVTILPWYRLDTAGASSKPRAVVLSRAEEVASLALPLDMVVLPPVILHNEFSATIRLKTGGCLVKQPAAVAYMDGTGG
jgi:hypothetical protein